MKLEAISLRRGTPRTHEAPPGMTPAGPWRSAIFREPLEHPVRVGPEGLEGDAVADTVHHGGRDKAVHVYPAEHLAAWAAEFPACRWEPGAFGENLCVRGATEDHVCLGDRFTMGSALFEVSQPRRPCVKLSLRWGIASLPKLVTETGRTGWYFRVIESGVVTPGDALTLTERRFPEWSVTRASRAMNERLRRPDEALALAGCAALAEGWREQLRAAAG